MARMTTAISQQLRAADIARALAQRTEDVAQALLGDPSSKSRRDLRWGRKGSFWLSCAGEHRGRWYDHERGEGGDLLDLIVRERNVPLGQAIAIASEMLGAPNVAAARYAKALRRPDDNAAHRTATALRLWKQSIPIKGTLAEKYFVVERQLPIAGWSLGHALRWHDLIGAIVALMTDPITGQAKGIHRTFLNRSGKKLDRRMLGRQGVIRLSPDDAITRGLGVTEGIEDGLAVLLSGWSPVWAATSAGAIARLPVLSGIESITVFADADDVGFSAAEGCCGRWQAARQEACIVAPRRPA
jgi:hypothetical protein